MLSSVRASIEFSGFYGTFPLFYYADHAKQKVQYQIDIISRSHNTALIVKTCFSATGENFSIFGEGGSTVWLFMSSVGFFLTLIIGVLAFVFSAIHFPGAMTQMISNADQLINASLDQYVADKYSVIIKFVFGGNNLVLMGFIVAARIVFSLLMGLFFPFSAADRLQAGHSERGSRSPRTSPFYRWGRPVS